MTKAPSWRTSSFGHAPDALPTELSELGEHLRVCRGPGGVRNALRYGVDTLHRGVAGHLVTTALAVLALVAVWAVLA